MIFNGSGSMQGQESTNKSLDELQAESFDRAGKATKASYPIERALQARELEAFLSQRQYAVLSTTRPDGRPLAAVILFMFWRGAFWLPSTEGATRMRNLASQPWASLVISDGEGSSHTAVVVEGPTVIHHDRRDIDDLFDRGLMRIWRERVNKPHDWVAALIELTPTKLLSYRAPRLS
jgi:general stress protein 26